MHVNPISNHKPHKCEAHSRTHHSASIVIKNHLRDGIHPSKSKFHFPCATILGCVVRHIQNYSVLLWWDGWHIWYARTHSHNWILLASMTKQWEPHNRISFAWKMKINKWINVLEMELHVHHQIGTPIGVWNRETHFYLRIELVKASSNLFTLGECVYASSCKSRKSRPCGIIRNGEKKYHKWNELVHDRQQSATLFCIFYSKQRDKICHPLKITRHWHHEQSKGQKPIL